MDSTVLGGQLGQARHPTVSAHTLPARVSDVVLAGAVAGQRDGFEALYLAFQPSLSAYFRAHEPRVADDLASDTWMSVARGIARFVGDSAGFRAWLFTIARRRLADHRRAAARRPEVLIDLRDDAHAEIAPAAEDVAFIGFDSDAALQRLAALPDEQGEVLLLRVVAGLSTAEVAHAMDKRVGTIRVLQHRALKRLAKDLRVDL